MSRLRLHRARQASPSAEAPRQRLHPSSPALSRETQPRSGRIIFAKGKFSLERGHVRLVSAHSAPRIQPSRSRARRFHFPTSRSEKLRECFARPLQQTAANLIRLCHHGKGGPRSRSGGKFRLGRHRKLESIGELF